MFQDELSSPAAADDVAARRALFPAGLSQPAGSFRFGADALLLAAFASRCIEAHYGAVDRIDVWELGCGCGAALLALSLRHDTVHGFGLDIEPELVTAASENARKLGLLHRTRWVVGDVRDISAFSGSRISGNALLVMANPPWLEQRHGKASSSRLRERAIVGGKGILDAFCGCGAGLLAPYGLLCVILAANSIMPFRDMCGKLGLAAVSTMPLLSFAGQAPRRTLAVASHAAAIREDKPLTLHFRAAGRVGWTEEALEFCPWLRKSVKSHGDAAHAHSSGRDQSFICTAKTLR